MLKECFPGFHFSPDFAQDCKSGIWLAFGAGGGQKANPLRETKITKKYIWNVINFTLREFEWIEYT